MPPLILSTTLLAELGHDTSANPAYNQTNFPANFTGTTWVDQSGTTLAVDSTKTDDSINPITPCHVSPVSVKTLIPNWPGRWGAHVVPFNFGGNHRAFGINTNTTAWVNACTADMQARGFDHIIIDSYGSARYEDNVTLKLQARIATMANFNYCLMIDTGDFGVTSGYGTTAQLQTYLAYINATYLSDPKYLTQGGKPVIYFWGVPVPGVNYTATKAL